MSRVWTAHERLAVIERYASVGAVALGAELDRSPDSVSSQARRHGLACPGYRTRQARSRAERSMTVNVRFFETATPASAFVLGYIWACGSVKTKYRKVLRMSCPRDNLDGLHRIRGLMESRNLVQTYEHQHVLEICNSLLVEKLTERFGIPPGRRQDGAPPRLPKGLLSRFAAGHLLATGSRGPTCVRFAGHRSVIQWLAAGITSQAQVPSPILNTELVRIAMHWSDPESIRRINAWLDH